MLYAIMFKRMHTNTNIAYIPASIFAWRQLEDAYVRHGQPTASTFTRDDYESQVCNQGAQHTHWHGEEANQDIIIFLSIHTLVFVTMYNSMHGSRGVTILINFSNKRGLVCKSG